MNTPIETQALTIWKQLYRQYQFGRALQGLLLFGMLFFPVAMITQLFDWSYGYFIAFFMGVSGVLGWILVNKNKFNPAFLTHQLNHNYPWLEFSAELIAEVPEQLLPRLQRQKILQLWVEKQKEVSVLPELKVIAAVFTGMLLLCVVLQVWHPTSFNFLPQNTLAQSVLPAVPENLKDKIPVIQSFQIRVEPPAYTRQAPRQAKELSLEAPENSVIHWHCQLNTPAGKFQVIWNGNDTLTITSKNNHYQWQTSLKTAVFYQIRYGKGNDWLLSPVYTLHAIDDQPPVITIKTPVSYTLVLYGQKPEV
ncbi:MAG: hypothetical protein H7Y04_11885, partial [Verrucomicrobia bacterium]|nr:hypothetical protein [Cytophagales bacterium]